MAHESKESAMFRTRTARRIGLAGRAAILSLGWSLVAEAAPVVQNAAPKVSEARKARAVEAIESGIAAVDGGDPRRAKAPFEKAIRADPSNPHGYYELAGVHLRERDFERARKAVERGRAVEPEFPGFYVLLGNLYDEAGDWKKARREYEAGLERHPGYPDLYLNLGIARWNRGEREEALEIWHRGTHVAPRFPPLHYHLARIWAATEQRFTVLLHAEAFLNLERAGARAEEMSRLLRKILDEAVRKEEGEEAQGEGEEGREVTFHITFTKQSRLTPEQAEGGILPLDMAFEATYGFCRTEVFDEGGSAYTVVEEVRARESFLDLWFGEMELHRKHDVPLFRRWRDLRGAGHLETYVRWILRAGFPEEFEGWKAEHQPALDALFEWLERHPFLSEGAPREGDGPR